MTAPIVELKVVKGLDDPGSNFVKIPVDLNRGAGGRYIYLCFRRGEGIPVDGLAVILGPQTPPPPGYKKLPTDLNEGARGEYIYCCYRNGTGLPLTDVVAISSRKDDQQPPQSYDHVPYSKVPVDLNKGAGGDYIYFYYLRRQPEVIPHFWVDGIPPSMLANPAKEYEVARVQVNYNLTIVRTLRLHTDDFFTLDAGMPLDKVIKKYQGVQESSVVEWAGETGFKFGGNWAMFSAAVDAKLSWKNTQSYETEAWVEVTDTMKLDPVDYRRKIHRCTLADALRVVTIPNGNTVSELETLTPIHGLFCTNRQGMWQQT